MIKSTGMIYTASKSRATTKTARLTAVLLALLLGALSGIQSICLGDSIAECDCCDAPVVQTDSCCSEDALPQKSPARDTSTPAQGEPPCCISLGGSLVLGLSTAPPQVPSLVLGTVTLLPAPHRLPGTPAGPAVTASPPPLRIPPHIEFCCPLA